MSDHYLWRVVGNNYRSLEAHAPEGYAPVADVYLAGVEAPIRLHQAETHREQPWVLLHSYDPEGEGDAAKAYPEDRLVFVHESLVTRVELRFVRKADAPFGFSHREKTDTDGT
jgi:hypothetical protein